jgi:polyisoprenoid-binding protein YceI
MLAALVERFARFASRAGTSQRRWAVGNWQLDPFHTQIEFAAKHLGMMTVRGHFAEVSTVADIDPEHPEASTVEVTIQTASIRTHNEARDNDLRSSNFLEVEKFPTITFKSTGAEPSGADRYALTGELTVKGITHPVTLQVIKYGEFNDPMMGHRIAYSATGQINRKEFGLTFNMMLDGRFVVSDQIQIMIEGELVEQQPAESPG